MAAFSSFARLPMLRPSVCWSSLMDSLSLALRRIHRPPGVGLFTKRSRPPRRTAGASTTSGGTAGVSARRSRRVPFAADPRAAGVTAVATGGHPHVVAQATGRAGGLDSDLVPDVHGAHDVLNNHSAPGMPEPPGGLQHAARLRTQARNPPPGQVDHRAIARRQERRVSTAWWASRMQAGTPTPRNAAP